jgi:hypothetical protein
MKHAPAFSSISCLIFFGLICISFPFSSLVADEDEHGVHSASTAPFKVIKTFDETHRLMKYPDFRKMALKGRRKRREKKDEDEGKDCVHVHLNIRNYTN